VGNFKILDTTFLTLRRRVNRMNKNKLVMGLSTIVLVASLGGGLAYAKGGASLHSVTDGDTVKTQNARQKTPHSARKEAAKRLKVDHQQQHQQKLNEEAKAHYGYTGHGQAGDSHKSNQISSGNRGEK
jgi:hypothetical protein